MADDQIVSRVGPSDRGGSSNTSTTARRRSNAKAKAGTPVAEIVRKLGASEQTFYRWKRMSSGMGVAELHRFKQPEEENRKLEQLVADLRLDQKMLQDVLRCEGGWLSDQEPPREATHFWSRGVARRDFGPVAFAASRQRQKEEAKHGSS